MRVISGKAKSLPLKAPSGMDTRPTTDRIKETLFNMINPIIYDSVFVDLFSGSGAIGIEALSRGASKAFFVENDRKAWQVIEENLRFTKLGDNAILLWQDANSALSRISEDEVDIIFMDPPYQSGLDAKALEFLKDQKYVTDKTLIIIEATLDRDVSFVEASGFYIDKVKKYKTNQHIFIKKA